MGKKLDNASILYGDNASVIQDIYERYLDDASSVGRSWADLFHSLPDLMQHAVAPQEGAETPTASVIESQCRDSVHALMLIHAYRVRGHLLADLDPLGIERREGDQDLELSSYGFSEADMDRVLYVGSISGFSSKYVTLRDLVSLLRKTYSSKIGVEFMHIASLESREWIATQMEHVRGLPRFSSEERRSMLLKMVELETFEQFLHKKFPGAKRFSAEGAESAFAVFENMVEMAVDFGIEEIVIGMPHRGRLNALTSVMGKRYAHMISEFIGNQIQVPESMDASGDVKYHHGASSDRYIHGKKIHLSLCANPSHLEAVNPVVLGRVRAKQDLLDDKEKRNRVVAILLHGDASFAGQGIVPESMVLNDLEGYRTGGTIHIIVNNQIGFTTSPRNARKSPYPSDIAKGIGAPVFHVNGDDPEAVLFVTQLAMNYRSRFQMDVVVDVFCYRRHGHNEGDEPSFTQPLMYKIIKNHPTPTEVYAQKLREEGTVSSEVFETMRRDFYQFLESELEEAKNLPSSHPDWLGGTWVGFAYHGRFTTA